MSLCGGANASQRNHANSRRGEKLYQGDQSQYLFGARKEDSFKKGTDKLNDASSVAVALPDCVFGGLKPLHCSFTVRKANSHEFGPDSGGARNETE